MTVVPIGARAVASACVVKTITWRSCARSASTAEQLRCARARRRGGRTARRAARVDHRWGATDSADFEALHQEDQPAGARRHLLDVDDRSGLGCLDPHRQLVIDKRWVYRPSVRPRQISLESGIQARREVAVSTTVSSRAVSASLKTASARLSLGDLVLRYLDRLLERARVGYGSQPLVHCRAQPRRLDLETLALAADRAISASRSSAGGRSAPSASRWPFSVCSSRMHSARA